MSVFAGYEIIPSAGLISSGSGQIRMTVSAKRVGLSERLLETLGKPSYISFHRGIAENAGKLIISAAEEGDGPGNVEINPEKRKVAFNYSEFVAMCGTMLRDHANGAFKRGTFYSIAGKKMGENAAVVFDFRNAVEHCVNAQKRIETKQPGFNMPRTKGFDGTMMQSGRK